MYRVFKDGEQLALLESPRFIKLQPNGYFGTCEEAEAQGVVIDNIAYSIDNRLEGRQSVSYQKVNVGDLIASLEAMQAQIDELTVDHEYRLALLEVASSGEVTA